MPSTLTTFTYTITVENQDDQPGKVNKIHDELPAGFSYVLGSTTGVTQDDPVINAQHLEWNLRGGINLTYSYNLVSR